MRERTQRLRDTKKITSLSLCVLVVYISPMSKLSLVTCQAINTVAVSRAIAQYLSERLRVAVEFRDDIAWQDAYRLVGEGEMDLAWICGMPYVKLADQPQPPVTLLAAPVMAEGRYEDRPIYFSDVVVHRDSPYRSFADLRGATWAYNEPGSQSGYHITRYHLATMGEGWSFFGRVVKTGAHRRSLKMVINGEIDASAIDSTVLEWVLEEQQAARELLQIIGVLGPSPIPPWVMSQGTAAEYGDRIREVLLKMQYSAEGRTVLAAGKLARFAAVSDAAYDPIRRMAELANSIAPAYP
jgi:phosphonate transport system substrate-binding protein